MLNFSYPRLLLRSAVLDAAAVFLLLLQWWNLAVAAAPGRGDQRVGVRRADNPAEKYCSLICWEKNIVSAEKTNWKIRIISRVNRLIDILLIDFFIFIFKEKKKNKRGV
jgi:hypothetical protein